LFSLDLPESVVQFAANRLGNVQQDAAVFFPCSDPESRIEVCRGPSSEAQWQAGLPQRVRSS
jgi:hypothetical protein